MFCGAQRIVEPDQEVIEEQEAARRFLCFERLPRPRQKVRDGRFVQALAGRRKAGAEREEWMLDRRLALRLVGVFANAVRGEMTEDIACVDQCGPRGILARGGLEDDKLWTEILPVVAAIS